MGFAILAVIQIVVHSGLNSNTQNEIRITVSLIYGTQLIEVKNTAPLVYFVTNISRHSLKIPSSSSDQQLHDRAFQLHFSLPLERLLAPASTRL
jgi:hypothetical protein